MTLRVFETNDANYYLGLGNHISSSAPIFEEIDFSTIDFMVLEDDPKMFEPSRILDFGQYRELTERVLKENPAIPFYCVDASLDDRKFSIIRGINGIFEIATAALAIKSYQDGVKKTETITRRSLLKKGIPITVGIYFYGKMNPMLHCGKKSIPYCETITGLHSLLFPSPIRGFRDSLAAKKISEHLVPQYKKENRKVNVAILYGAAHAGIEAKLRFPSLNQNTLSLYHDWLGVFSPEEMNTVGVIKKENGELRTYHYNCNIF